METEEKIQIIPNHPVPVPKIFDVEFKNLFYNPTQKKFYIKKNTKKVKSLHNMRELAWNQIHPKYTNKSGEEHVYTYRFVLVPHGKKYIRIKEGELEAFYTSQNESAQS
jgi:hypothetical protein